MRNKVAKKLRQYTRRNWRGFYKEIKALPLKNRIRIAWFIVADGEYQKLKNKLFGRSR